MKKCRRYARRGYTLTGHTIMGVVIVSIPMADTPSELVPKAGLDTTSLVDGAGAHSPLSHLLSLADGYVVYVHVRHCNGLVLQVPVCVDSVQCTGVVDGILLSNINIEG